MPCGRVFADMQLLSRQLTQIAPAQANSRSFGVVWRNGTSLVWLAVVVAVAGAFVNSNLTLGVYLLSFLHYGLYWWACAFGVRSFGAFKRDAIALKTISVAGLAFVYLHEPLDPASLSVIAAGILLNVRAAAALGLDRTYYGHELAGLPPLRITAFPYSLTDHPMILGNVAAFGGTLINPLFREGWWPLAGLHVALNLGLLAMELAMERDWPRRRRAVWIGGGLVLAGAQSAAVRAGNKHNRNPVSSTLKRPGGTADAEPQAQPLRRFPATVGRFDDPADRAVIDGLTRWVEERYREDLRKRPSKHVYIESLPADVVERIDRLRDSPLIRALIARQVPAGSTIVPMKQTDELYLSHYNKDRGGDQGLFDRHYDGNLRFLSSSIVVRALIYLQSDATYRVVFADSRLEKAFTTYEFGLLDFHRELHWVEGAFNPADRQRILLKCNYLVMLPHAASLGRAALLANVAVFCVVKAAMEYSKSPHTPAQVLVGFLCNLFRRLNNIHPLVPLALIAGLLAALVVAIGHGVSIL